MTELDPDDAGLGEGVFGLPQDHARAGAGAGASVVLVPVPFEATVSRFRGAARGPVLIKKESAQVDLFDLETGHPYRAGIVMQAPDPRIEALDAEVRADAERVIEAGGPVDAETAAARDRVDEASRQVNAIVEERVTALLDAQKIAGTIGGDHSVALGAIAAHAKRYGPGLGVLQFDAHADLREAYEGFTYSHASVMERVLAEISGVERLVQVGVRDLGVREHGRIQEDPRVKAWFGPDLARARLEGRLLDVMSEVVDALPERVYVSFDIDGLDPKHCPGTGTPVPGGLSFEEASILLSMVAGRRRIVGFDLVEVAGGPLDGDVGARVLYKLIGWTLRSLREAPSP